MLSRTFLRRIFPSSFQVFNAIKKSNKHVILLSSDISATNYIPNACLLRLYSQQAKPEEITVDYEYVKRATLRKDVLIVDVREPDEIKEHGKISNSINIPLGNVISTFSTMPENEFQQTYKRAKPKEDTEIIFYCMIGKRSGKAQQNALGLGYKNARNYPGSWTEWATKSQ